jgi:peptidoglycan/LPS O-acetylase OafA/YrhL
MNEYHLKEGSSVILDLIRGLSAQAVVFGHAMSFFGVFTFLHEPHFPWIQHIAVLIFFLLSGFLVTYATAKKTSIGSDYNFAHYFADRFSRIYTAFIPAIFFVLIVDIISNQIDPTVYSHADSFNLKSFLTNLCMFQDFNASNYFPLKNITSFGSANSFWSLAIEWWLYMFFGFVVLVILKKRSISISNSLILLFFSIFPLINAIGGRGNGLTLFWFFGVLIYVLLTIDLLSKISRTVKIIAIIVIVGVGFTRICLSMEVYDAVFAFLMAVALWLIVDVFKDVQFPERLSKWIKFNASYSYTLYLLHYSILDFMYAHFRTSTNPYLLFVVGFIVSNVLSILIGRYVEITLTKKIKAVLYRWIDKKKASLQLKM